MASRQVVGRRRLLVLGAAAAAIPACSGNETPLGGPYGGAGSAPGPTEGSQSAGNSSGNSGTGSGNGSGIGSSSSSGGPGNGSGNGADSGSGNGSDMDSSTGGLDSGSGTGSSSGNDGSTGGQTCSTSGNVLALPFSQYPGLMSSGGSVLKNVSGYSDPNCGLSGIIVINTGSGYSALSTACTHQCCNVSIKGSELHCPCHGQNFNFQGQPTTGGKTSRPLPSLQVCSDSTGVYVTY